MPKFTNAFLPGAFKAPSWIPTTRIEDIIKNIKSEFARRDQRKQLDLLLKINEVHKQKRPAEGDLEARINSFELAYRMQTDAQAFDIAGEKPETVAKYGANAQGRQMLIARRLLERGVRFVQVRQGGWDLHGGQRSVPPTTPASSTQLLARSWMISKSAGFLRIRLLHYQRIRSQPTEDGGGGRSRQRRGLSTVLWVAVSRAVLPMGQLTKSVAPLWKTVHVKDIHATVMDLLGFDHEQLTYRTVRLTQATRSLPQGGMPVKGIIA